MSLVKLNARSATALDATVLTGNLPSISGASLTGLASDYVKILAVDVTSSTASVSFEHGTGGVDFTGTTYRSHVIVYSDVHMVNDNDRAYIQFKDDGGSYENGTGDYLETRLYVENGSTGVLNAGASQIRVSNGGTDSGRRHSTQQGVLNLYNFNQSANQSMVQYQSHTSFVDSNSYDNLSYGVHRRQNEVKTSGIKFIGGGSIEYGTFTLYSRK
tara:strand:+ start:208 stop:852 length:645 start_codon:yes stop_codon:yes gene_type:complete